MAVALTDHTLAQIRQEEKKKPSHRKVRDAIASMQGEIWDLTEHNTRMLDAIAKLLCGQVHEQRQAIATMIDLISSDIRLAQRMLRIMETNPHMKVASPELYEHALRAATPA